MKSQWWYRAPALLEREKGMLDGAIREHEWLECNPITVAEDTGDLLVNFDLTVGGRQIPLVLLYPPLYPVIGPAVFSQDGLRLSYHQYGASGELCLELRPDTWDKDCHSGVDAILSAYRLLSTEEGKLYGPDTVPNAHEETLAIACRGEPHRWILPETLVTAYRDNPFDSPAELRVAIFRQEETTVMQVFSIGPETEPWRTALCPTSPFPLLEGYCVSLPKGTVTGGQGPEDLSEILKKHGYLTLVQKLIVPKGENRVLLIVGRPDQQTDGGVLKLGQDTSSSDWHLVILRDDGAVHWIYQIYDDTRVEARQPATASTLPEKKVAIVGCGSIGSKVAASLTRQGVSSFVLLDPDIMFSGNVARHDLDQTTLGFEKVCSVEARIGAINPVAKVEKTTSAIGGQLPMSFQEGLMEMLGTVDLIVDATAEPRVFYYLAIAATEARVPMVWGQVFAGGIGGEILRARPDQDPPPLIAKAQADAWYAQNAPEMPETDNAERYGGMAGGTPVTAMDAEVSVIAGHLAAFATDILLNPEATKFPYSAYAIGFAKEWLFEEPFVVQPIQFEAEGSWGCEDRELSDEDVGMLKQCLGRWPLE